MSKLITVRFIFSIAAILAAAAIVIAATYAFLSDTETSEGNTFEAGVIDLKIDNTSYYNGALNEGTTWELDDLDGHLFFNFHDLKPGDWGEDTISIHVNNNDAWGCFDTTLTTDDDVSTNEPELEDGDTPEDEGDPLDGELGENLNFVFWVDDGDNVLEDNETGENILAQGAANVVLDGLSVTLADSLDNLFEEDGPLLATETYYIAKAWCFGTLTQTPVPAGQGVDPTFDGGITCDGSQLSNITQTDALTADVAFSAVQSRNNAPFFCDGTPTPSPTVITPTPTNTPTPTFTPTPTPPQISCETNDIQYASSFADNDQGLRKDSSAVLASRSDPSFAFGVPETAGLPSDPSPAANTFFSLGFPLGGNTASIVFGFAQPFYPNAGGPDLQIFEVTGGDYPDEKVKVEVSPDGTTWTLATASAIRDADIELPIPFAQYVRLTDVSDINIFTGTGDATPDGYDVDAIKTFCREVNP